MSHEDATDGATEESRDDQRSLPGTDDLPGADDLPAAVPDAAQPSGLSGPLAGIGGGVLLLRGIRQFRRGARLRGAAQAVGGGALVALAAGGRLTGRRRGGDVDETEVVDTGPDLEDAVEEIDEEAGDDAGGATDDAAAQAEAEESAAKAGAADEESPDLTTKESDSGEVADEDAETVSEDSFDAGQQPLSSVDTDEEAETDDADAGEAETQEETDEDAATEEAEIDEGAEADADEDAMDDSFDAGQQELSSSDTDGETDTDEEADADDAADGEAATDETDDESDAGAETPEQSYDRLGAAAFDDDSNRLPAPQRAFNQEYLSGDAGAEWGIREADGAVVVTRVWDAIEDREELRYVASTEVGDERMLDVPSEIVDHWNDFGEGVAVESGTDLVFATSDDLKADDLLLVVPEPWADEALDVED